MKIGYIRISCADQNIARQEVIMRELGVEQIFIDRMSGKNMNRPELKRMMEFVREGDVVIVESISRFARNTKDLLELVEQLTNKHVEFVSKKEAIDTSTPTGKFMLTVFGGFSLKDISSTFGKSESWARVTFYRAKQKLLERMR